MDSTSCSKLTARTCFCERYRQPCNTHTVASHSLGALLHGIQATQKLMMETAGPDESDIELPPSEPWGEGTCSVV